MYNNIYDILNKKSVPIISNRGKKILSDYITIQKGGKFTYDRLLLSKDLVG